MGFCHIRISSIRPAKKLSYVRFEYPAPRTNRVGKNPSFPMPLVAMIDPLEYSVTSLVDDIVAATCVQYDVCMFGMISHMVFSASEKFVIDMHKRKVELVL